MRTRGLQWLLLGALLCRADAPRPAAVLSALPLAACSTPKECDVCEQSSDCEGRFFGIPRPTELVCLATIGGRPFADGKRRCLDLAAILFDDPAVNPCDVPLN